MHSVDPLFFEEMGEEEAAVRAARAARALYARALLRCPKISVAGDVCTASRYADTVDRLEGLTTTPSVS
jgi:hypothetical protein